MIGRATLRLALHQLQVMVQGLIEQILLAGDEGRVCLVRLQLFLQVLVEVELVLVDVSSFEVKVVDVPRDRLSSLLRRRRHLLPVPMEEQRLVEFALLLQVDLADDAGDLLDLLLVDAGLTEVTVDPPVGEEQRLAQLSSLVEQFGQSSVEIDEGEIFLQLVHQFVLQRLQIEVNGLLVVVPLPARRRDRPDRQRQTSTSGRRTPFVPIRNEALRANGARPRRSSS